MRNMRRRQFLELAGLTAAICPASLFAAHRLISNDPLIIETDFAGNVEAVTSYDDFTIYNHYSLPVLPPPANLPIGGDVVHPYSIGIERLITLTPAKVTAVLESAGNGVGPRGLMSNGVWEGWRLADVLRFAQPEKEAAWVNFYGADGYVRSVPLDRVMGCGLLIDRLNARLLDKTHGLPFRAAFPGWYGMDWVKWLSRIQVVKEPLASADNDYLELWRGPGGRVIRRQLPPVQAKSVIVSPLKGAVLNAGKVELSGVAWSGNGVSKVEVSADGGSTWSEARLDTAETWSWRVWRTELVLHEQGLVTLACRATDSQGVAQPAGRDPFRLDYFALNEFARIRCLVV